MKTTQSLLTSEDEDTIYSILSETFGDMKVDSVYFDLTHQQY